MGKLFEKLARSGRQLKFCCEAGPCGYGVYRQLLALGHPAWLRPRRLTRAAAASV
ncbi:MAG: hypothetical protein JOY71_20420 [Acetobacteraceae bacterium]|nr:hypothetical protein [Acetobacteraceae bacterium]MBV8524457.1 hypothetical protein [Acetobacteraceae bacterium]